MSVKYVGKDFKMTRNDKLVDDRRLRKLYADELFEKIEATLFF